MPSDQVAANDVTPVASEPDQATHLARSGERTRLRGNRLLIARGVWASVVLLAIGLFVSAIPARFSQLLTAVPLGNMATAQLAPEELVLLQASGYAMTQYAIYFIAVDIICAGVFALIGLAIFWRKSDDWFAIFISLTLVSFGAMIPATRIGERKTNNSNPIMASSPPSDNRMASCR